MKKIAAFALAALASFALTSCMSTNMKSHGAFELPESPKEAMERVAAYEMADDMARDKKFKEGRLTWETNSKAAREQGIQHYLYFFAARDKTLDSKRNSAGGKRDIAGTLYFSLAEKANMHPSFNGNL